MSARSSKVIAWGIIFLALLCSVMVIVALPSTVASSNDDVMHLRSAGALFVTLSSFGGSVFFLGGIKKFKTELKVAYTLLAIGFMLFGIALLQLPIAGFFDLWDTWWANSGLIILPFGVATLLLYIGMRQFARLLHIKSLLTSYLVVIGTAVVATAIGYLTGHYFARYRNIAGTDLYIATVAWSTTFIVYAALLAWHVKTRIGLSYQPAMRGLFTALTTLSIGGLHELVINYFVDNSSWYVSHGTSFIPFMVGGVTVVIAAYSFSLLGASSVPVIAVRQAPDSNAPDSYAADVASMATLVSWTNPSDPELSDVRSAITQAASGQPLQSESTEGLLNTYRKIEHYLVNDDPLRRFDKEELRSALKPELRAALEKQHTVHN